MKLKYIADYLSITQFNNIEIPPFLVLTGLNGSGKTHLLQAIKNGNVSIEDTPKEQIIHFDNSLFGLDNEPIVTSRTIQDEKTNVFVAINERFIKREYLKNISVLVPEISEVALQKNKSFYYLTPDDFAGANLSDKFKSYNQYVRQIFSEISQITTGTEPQLVKTACERLIKEIQKPLELLTREEFDDLYVPLKYKNDFLINSLGRVFSDYWGKWELNQYRTFRNSNYNESHKVFNEQDFVKVHGSKPWELINDIISGFGSLDYKVNSPVGLERGHPFQLKLISTKNEKITIDFGHLSSGERTMMALVSSLYKSKIDKNFPSVLLLDEIDASLHPSMSQSMLKVIDHELVNTRNLKVILVTHSPSTVALAPENSIYLMNKAGLDRIIKSTNKEALSILTEGFASLTIAESNLKITYNIKNSSKYVLLTEGIIDKIILEAAWKQLENTNPNFDIQDCFDASYLRNLFSRQDIFVNYPTKAFIALFDFDKEGYESWNGLSNYDVIENDPKKGLLKKHKTNNAYALLLPVPTGPLESQVIQSGIATFKEKSHLPIELMFYGVPSLASRFANESQVGGGTLIKFHGDKTAFAKDVATSLAAADFQTIKPLFAAIQNIFK
jgi:predicted ATP-dependent endonuclease of OLD family